MAILYQCNVCGRRSDEIYVLTADNSFVENFGICEDCTMNAYNYLQDTKPKEIVEVHHGEM